MGIRLPRGRGKIHRRPRPALRRGGSIGAGDGLQSGLVCTPMAAPAGGSPWTRRSELDDQGRSVQQAVAGAAGCVRERTGHRVSIGSAPAVDRQRHVASVKARNSLFALQLDGPGGDAPVHFNAAVSNVESV